MGALPGLRAYLLVRTLFAVIGTALVIAQMVTAAAVLATAVQHGAAAVREPALPWLVAALAGRAVLSGLETWYAGTAAATLKRRLRSRLTDRALRSGGTDPATVSVLLGRGADAVDGYLTGFVGIVPALLVTPVAVVVAIALLDWPSALVVLVTLPIVPGLLALVGMQTGASTARQWRVLHRLGGQFLDAVSGLATLRVLGRERRTAERVRKVAEQHRRVTMRTLRLAFLSTLTLESLTTVAVALVAVPVGLRLMSGALPLAAGLAVLLLTPEVYRPLRLWGAQFHAAQDGRAALKQINGLLPGAPPAPTAAIVPSAGAAPATMVLEGLAVGHPGRESPVLSGIDLTFVPGRRYALVGPSGGGKSTLVRTLSGLAVPLAGTVRIEGRDLHLLPADLRTSRIGLVPQRPHLFAGTVAENVALGLTGVPPEQIWSALERAAAADLVRDLPDGLDTVLGEFGARLSAGERQRLALARVLVRDPAFVLLDEPTARLDGETEQSVLATFDALPATSVVLVVTHRPAVLERADEVLRVEHGTIHRSAVPV